MDINAAFSKSMSTLRKRPELIVPPLATGIILLIFLTAFLFLSGLQPLLLELTTPTAAFNAEYEPESTADAFSLLFLQRSEPYKKAFEQYLRDNDFQQGRFFELITPVNIGLFVLLLLILSSLKSEWNFQNLSKLAVLICESLGMPIPTGSSSVPMAAFSLIRIF